MRLDMLGTSDLPAGSTDDEVEGTSSSEIGAYFLTGTYLDDLDGDSEEVYFEAHGCLPRLRTWTAELLHPRRHSRRLSWSGLQEFHYNVLQ